MRAATSLGGLRIGPSLSRNGQMMQASAPDVASQKPSADHAMDFTRDGYPVMRMCFLSSMRQPCSAASCIPVTTKRPSGENVVARCEPFQSSSSGGEAALGNHRLAPL